MDKIDIAKDLMERIGIPTAQQSMLCCLTLSDMASIKKDRSFQDATGQLSTNEFAGLPMG